VARSTAVSDLARRHYDSTLRRARAADTRNRIVDAGCTLLGGASVGDWRGLTIRGVADSAGVHESTVYRHFGTERGLKDAVMQRLEERAGIDLDVLELDDIAEVSARIVEVVSSHPFGSRAPLDTTLVEAGRRQREALLRAVGGSTAQWSDSDRHVAAAMFDVLWSVSTYERLAMDWEFDRDSATEGITWVIGMIEEAVRAGRRPGGESAGD
jgi:AcrR family transcriptional regulator